MGKEGETMKTDIHIIIIIIYILISTTGLYTCTYMFNILKGIR